MLGVPRQIKGPKPWPLHPWMVLFYDGKWRCQVGVLRDTDYSSGSNERTFTYYVQNVRQNSIQYQGGNVVNEKGATSNPKTFALKSSTWTGGNKLYYKADGNGMGIPSNPSLVPEDGCVKWPSGSFSSIQDTYVFLTKENDKWCVVAQSGNVTWKEDDIVIAKVEPTSGSQTGWLVAQVLKSDVFIGGGGGPTDHPWKVTCGDSASKVEVRIQDGSINNVMLDNPTYVHEITAIGEYSVLLKVTCANLVYPEKVIWSVVKDWANTPNTLTEGWLKAAHIKVVKEGDPETYVSTITQLFSSSFWSERIKFGSGLNSARYYFNRI